RDNQRKMARILLLEDQPFTASLIATVLRDLGHSVVRCKDGREGLKALHDDLPDLLITDIIMPEVDGNEVIRAIRGEGLKLPIIAVSGGGPAGSFDGLEVAKKLGANETIRKPVTRPQLLAAVERCLLLSGGGA